jgi:hypothetical protein
VYGIDAMKIIIRKNNFKKVSAGIFITILVSLVLIPSLVAAEGNTKGEIKMDRKNDYFATPDSITGVFTESTWQYKGDMQGYTYVLREPIHVIVTSWLAQAKVEVKFIGTIGDSEQGTFKAYLAGETNPNLGYNKGLRAKLTVIEGSGTGGLVGICGGGTVKGLEPAPGQISNATYEYQFQFGEACE